MLIPSTRYGLPDLPDVAATRRERGPHDGWHHVGAAGEPAFAGTWMAARDQVSFAMFHHGFVGLRGELKTTGAAGSDTMFTLPAGFRPFRQHRWVVDLSSNDALNREYVFAYVDTTGAVRVPNVSGWTVYWLSIDTALFSVR